MQAKVMINSDNTTGLSTLLTKSLQLTSAFFLGVIILYGVGFVSAQAVHNAAHDVRHSQGFPCH